MYNISIFMAGTEGTAATQGAEHGTLKNRAAGQAFVYAALF